MAVPAAWLLVLWVLLLLLAGSKQQARSPACKLTWSMLSVCGTTKQRLTLTVPSEIVPSSVPITLSCFSPRLMYESQTCSSTTGCTLTLMLEPLMGSSSEATMVLLLLLLCLVL